MQKLHKVAKRSYVRWSYISSVTYAVLAAGCGSVQPLTSETKVIYGDDDRKDLYDTNLTPALRTLAQSTVALVKKLDALAKKI